VTDYLSCGRALRLVNSIDLGTLTLQGKSPQYPLSERLDGPQSHSERDSEDKSLKKATGI
jgi:hypothetical protein